MMLKKEQAKLRKQLEAKAQEEALIIDKHPIQLQIAVQDSANKTKDGDAPIFTDRAKDANKDANQLGFADITSPNAGSNNSNNKLGLNKSLSVDKDFLIVDSNKVRTGRPGCKLILCKLFPCFSFCLNKSAQIT